MFSSKDLEQLENLGIPTAVVEKQIQTFKEGIPFAKLDRAAVIGDGILEIKADEENELISFYEAHSKTKSLLKFVPASGAASRMFKALFAFIDNYNPRMESFSAYVGRTNDTDLETFAAGIERFSFYPKVMERIEGRYENEDEKLKEFVREMLSEDGLNYGFYPKGLLPFHRCKKGSAPPFKEHLKEAAAYAKAEGVAQLHFTISPQHQELFAQHESEWKPRIAGKTDTTFEICYSFQKPSTDTIAVNEDNTPFREEDDSLLFRPGGHGALIENLNEQKADVIFIKNIDNVVIDKNLEAVVKSKKMLAGVLLKIQFKTFDYLIALEGDLTKEELISIKDFAVKQLNVNIDENFDEWEAEKQKKWLIKKLNRPIRVCGMVRNEGEPGGGPFWVNNQNTVSLQIIESAQVDMANPEQKKILQQSTHFNPVDLVCGILNYKGEKFDLLEFVDPEQGFISSKTKDGKPLKALELPGLWNGAMAYWNTIFVEVPSVTFNPVKTVNDLLKPSHQA